MLRQTESPQSRFCLAGVHVHYGVGISTSTSLATAWQSVDIPELHLVGFSGD